MFRLYYSYHPVVFNITPLKIRLFHIHRIGCVIVSLFASGVVDRGFDHWQHNMCATFSANVTINNRLPIKVYHRICTPRHIRIEINHESQNVFWVLTWLADISKYFPSLLARDKILVPANPC